MTMLDDMLSAEHYIEAEDIWETLMQDKSDTLTPLMQDSYNGFALYGQGFPKDKAVDITVEPWFNAEEVTYTFDNEDSFPFDYLMLIEEVIADIEDQEDSIREEVAKRAMTNDYIEASEIIDIREKEIDLLVREFLSGLAQDHTIEENSIMAIKEDLLTFIHKRYALPIYRPRFFINKNNEDYLVDYPYSKEDE